MKKFFSRLGASVVPVVTNKRVLVATATAVAAAAGSAASPEAIDTLVTLALALVGG